MWLPLCLPSQHERFIRSRSAFQIRPEGLYRRIRTDGVSEVALAVVIDNVSYVLIGVSYLLT